MKNLERKVKYWINKLGIYEEEKEYINTLLKKLKKHHEPTYRHCLRVGILCAKASSYFSYDEKIMFVSGLLHDIGKLEIESQILRKKHIDEEDFIKIEEHPVKGYEMLKEKFEIPAEIILRHHTYGNGRKRHYPKNIPKNEEINEETYKKINEYSKLLSIIDFYDAGHRRTDAFKNKVDKFSNTELKNLLLEIFNEDREIVEKLYQKKVFV